MPLIGWRKVSSAAREWAIVAGVFAVLAGVAAAWLAIDRLPPQWDHANHLERVVTCAGDLARGDAQRVLERSSFYPPFVPCTAALVYRLWPTDEASAQAVILLFLGLGMAATYLLGRRFSGGAAGVVAATAFGTAPFVVYISVRFQLDLPLAAMVALAIEVLLRTEGFRRSGWALGAGIVVGLGLLTKPTFLVYVLVPIVLLAVQIADRRRLANAAAALAIAIVLSLPWYGLRLFGLSAQIGSRSFRQAAESGHPHPLSAAALGYYPQTFAMQFGAIAVALFVIGLLIAVRRHRMLLASVVLPFAVFELIQNKNLRYTLPLLPLAATLAGLGFAALPRRARLVAGILLVAAGGLQVSATAFGVPPDFRIPGIGMPLAFVSPPSREDWRQREILALIASDSGGAPTTVSVVPNYSLFSVSNFRYYAVRDGRPFSFSRAWDDEPLGLHYMILKTGDVGPSWTAAKIQRVNARLASDRNLARIFPVIGEFPLPDGSVGSVRVRRMPVGLDVAPSALARAITAGLRRGLSEVARDVEGFDVRLQYDRDILTGHVTRVEISAATATLGEWTRRNPAVLKVEDLRIVIDDLLVNPYSAWEEGRLQPLDARRFRLERARIRAADLGEFLRHLKGAGRTSVTLSAGFAEVSVGLLGPDVSARVRLLAVHDRPFAIEAERVHIGVVPVPEFLTSWVIRSFDPAPRIAARMPFPVEIGPVTMTPSGIELGEPGR
jgi:dolichyl-phosphate-mannose-protein mannosyltransferase/DUF2993 family protein